MGLLSGFEPVRVVKVKSAVPSSAADREGADVMLLGDRNTSVTMRPISSLDVWPHAVAAAAFAKATVQLLCSASATVILFQPACRTGQPDNCSFLLLKKTCFVWMRVSRSKAI